MSKLARADSRATARTPADSSEISLRLAGVPRRAATFAVTVPAPHAPLEAVFSETTESAAMLWEPETGISFAALGAVETVVGAGAHRVESVRDAAAAALRTVEPLGTVPDVCLPRFVGGFSFAAGSARSAPWTAFGDARFFLPRYSFVRADGEAFFTVILRGDAADRGRITETAERLFAAILASAAPRPPFSSSRRNLRTREEVSLDQWTHLVEDALSEIARGALEKVVAARRTRFEFDEKVDVSDVLHELASSSPNATRFAIRFDDTTFLGTTPERLAKKAGRVISTEALAGSVASAGEATLVENPKERAEHEFVRREILRRLEPLCERISYPPLPEVRLLRHIAHLRTPFEATLATPLHVLDLVDRLHPTPAVGGVPAAEAVRWISEHESVERGWYAAPIGWFDAQGDGELCVALRSGVIQGPEAYLYAGGGIVQGSDPAAEYAETELKLASLSGALRAAR